MSQTLSGSRRAQSASRAIVVSRVVHALIAVGLLACIGIVYFGAWRGEAGTGTLVALGVLCVEGVLVIASGGDCPLTPFLRRLGDTTPLFELILPPRVARLAVPVLGTITGIGIVLLGIRTI